MILIILIFFAFFFLSVCKVSSECSQLEEYVEMKRGNKLSKN